VIVFLFRKAEAKNTGENLSIKAAAEHNFPSLNGRFIQSREEVHHFE